MTTLKPKSDYLECLHERSGEDFPPVIWSWMSKRHDSATEFGGTK